MFFLGKLNKDNINHQWVKGGKRCRLAVAYQRQQRTLANQVEKIDKFSWKNRIKYRWLLTKNVLFHFEEQHVGYYLTRAPKGIRASFAILKHCRPAGMPMMVMQQTRPTVT